MTRKIVELNEAGKTQDGTTDRQKALDAALRPNPESLRQRGRDAAR